MSGRCGVTNIQGRRLAVGEATILRLAYLLGLEKAPPDFSIKSAAWIENHLELSVGVGNDQEVAFALERAKPDERAFVVTDHLLLRYRGKLLPPSTRPRRPRTARGMCWLPGPSA